MYFVELYYSMVPSVFLSKAGTLSIFPHALFWVVEYPAFYLVVEYECPENAYIGRGSKLL
jgi:hypothetical protein